MTTGYAIGRHPSHRRALLRSLRPRQRGHDSVVRHVDELFELIATDSPGDPDAVPAAAAYIGGNVHGVGMEAGQLNRFLDFPPPLQPDVQIVEVRRAEEGEDLARDFDNL